MLIGRLRLRPAMGEGGGDVEAERLLEEAAAMLVRDLVAKRVLDMDGHGADRLRPYEVNLCLRLLG